MSTAVWVYSAQSRSFRSACSVASPWSSASVPTVGLSSAEWIIGSSICSQCNQAGISDFTLCTDVTQCRKTWWIMNDELNWYTWCSSTVQLKTGHTSMLVLAGLRKKCFYSSQRWVLWVIPGFFMGFHEF